MEPILYPDLPIIDAHHHLWVISEKVQADLARADGIIFQGISEIYRRYPRYLLDDLLTDLNSGHNVIATVYNDSHAMYKASGPAHLLSVGEVEFANGIAAMSASGLFGTTRACAGIVGNVDLSVGDAVEDALHAHLRAGGDRYRGIRNSTLYDDDPTIIGGGLPHRLADPEFRKGFRRLQPLGLSFDALVLEPQLSEVIDLARAFPETQIILNHLGFPLGVGRFRGRREERFPIWRDHIRELATCDNVAVKLGAIGSPFAGFPSTEHGTVPNSQLLASRWRPYVETCIEAFGVKRCMFESNFPMDSSIGAYSTVWNVFKRLTEGASPDEKAYLFHKTAARVYHLDVLNHVH